MQPPDVCLEQKLHVGKVKVRSSKLEASLKPNVSESLVSATCIKSPAILIKGTQSQAPPRCVKLELGWQKISLFNWILVHTKF